MKDKLVKRLRVVKSMIAGCESLTLATTDGLLLASTQSEKQGELLSAVTSIMLQSCASFMGRFEREVDPDGTLPPSVRARRARAAKAVYFSRLALRSAKSRARKASGST